MELSSTLYVMQTHYNYALITVYLCIRFCIIIIQLTASETKSYDDAFTLETVAEPLLDKFNFVAGIVPVLTTHLAQVHT